jgi:hypothetical protein
MLKVFNVFRHILKILVEHLKWLEMNLVYIEYSKALLQKCNQCFCCLTLFLNDLKRRENEIQMNNNWNTPLQNNEMWFYFFFVKVIFYNYKNYG